MLEDPLPQLAQPRTGGGVNTACVILARAGSKGLPGKNLRTVGGLSLVARSVRAARAAQGVDVVYVSTDGAAIAAEARRHGAEVIERPAAIAGDTASSEAGWLHALEQMRAAGIAPQRLVFLQCTSPFTTGADIDACLTGMSEAGAACALSVVEDHSFLWTRDEAGRGRGVNHDETAQRQRRQDLPPAFRENGAIYCVACDAFERVGRRFCGPVHLHPVDHPPVEIDTAADLALCTLLARDHDALPVGLANIRAVAMDFDGVHTDDLVQTDQAGTETVTTSRGDGLGLERLRKAGHWRLVIVSKERNPVVQARATKLKTEAIQAVDDKVSTVAEWLAREGISWEETIFVGNDINDAAVMARAGIGACPSDANPRILAQADWILPAPGGRGAVRALCDALLAVHGGDDKPHDE